MHRMAGKGMRLTTMAFFLATAVSTGCPERASQPPRPDGRTDGATTDDASSDLPHPDLPPADAPGKKLDAPGKKLDAPGKKLDAPGTTKPDGALPDGYILWSCPSPGKACNAHDPCAINPICGSDKKCHPQALQDCDDGLSCTLDSCSGMGMCSNTPKAGTCAVPVKGSSGTQIKCFKMGAKSPQDPCLGCNPSTSTKKWSPLNGGYCDDGNTCSKNDYCQNGVCKGVYYGAMCADAFVCTEDLCDGKGGCLGNKLMSGWCMINGTCYKDGAKQSGSACLVCDVKKSQTSWTKIC